MSGDKTKDVDDVLADVEESLNPKRRGLGRGLGALFEDEEGIYPQADPDGQTPGTSRLVLGVDQLSPGKYQPRKVMNDDSLTELAESIAAHGVLQPILVREIVGEPGKYEIIAGERRWRAAQKAQLHEVPVVVKQLENLEALEVALIENLQREDLNPLEEAEGYMRLIEEFGHTQEKLAASLGKSRSYVANITRLVNLPMAVQTLVRQGKLSVGHARALVTADDPLALATQVVAQGFSVRETERLVAEEAGRVAPPSSGGKKKSKPKDVNTLALEEEISAILGMAVSIDMRSTQAGSLKIDFKSLDQLDEVLHRLSHFPGRQQTG